jgi:hypothetical protein
MPSFLQKTASYSFFVFLTNPALACRFFAEGSLPKKKTLIRAEF